MLLAFRQIFRSRFVCVLIFIFGALRGLGSPAIITFG